LDGTLFRKCFSKSIKKSSKNEFPIKKCNIRFFSARTKLLTESNGSLSSSVYIGNGNGTAGADNLEESKYAKKAAAERNIRLVFCPLQNLMISFFWMSQNL
jgi:hypothetical protein